MTILLQSDETLTGMLALVCASATLAFVVHVWPFADVRNSSTYDVSRFFHHTPFLRVRGEKGLNVWL